MAVSEFEATVLARLRARLQRDTNGHALGDRTRARLGFKHLDAYYNGMQRLEQLGLAVPPELRRFITVVAWPATCVDSVEQRIDLEGFRLPGAADADKEMWRIWQANGLDEESQLAHLDSLIYGRSFTCVGRNEEDDTTPLVTVESATEMTGEWDPRRRALSAAAKFYVDDSSGEKVERATLYLPDVTAWLVKDQRGDWVEDEDGSPGRDQHNLGRVPVVALTNSPRLAARDGQSYMLRAIDLTDATARALTNAQVAAELMAIPQRWAVGVAKDGFVDETGKSLTVWESYFGAISMSENKDAKFGQFAAAELSNFKTIVDMYGQLLAGVYGLPLRYLGQLTTNPPSAEAITADESRLVKTVERKERGFAGSWEQTMRLVRRFVDGDWNPDLRQMETLWKNPATPTRAQTIDAAIKSLQGDRPLITVRQAREDVGYSEVQIQRMEATEEAAFNRADPLTAQLLAGLPVNSQAGAAAPEPVPLSLPEG